MSRGPLPSMGMDVAHVAARMRGRVLEFRRSSKIPANFLIVGCGCFALVRVQKAQRLHGSPDETERDFHEAVVLLRSVPCGGPVTRELWLYSRYGVLRYFRVDDARLVELGPDGKVPERTAGDGQAPTEPGA